MRKAIYPGTFDPATVGHLDIVREAAQLFDEVVIAVGINPSKVPLFSPDERLQMLRESIAEHGWNNVAAVTFDGLTVDCARDCNARYIVRGLRAVTDFEAEFALVLGNEQLESSIKNRLRDAGATSHLSQFEHRAPGGGTGGAASFPAACRRQWNGDCEKNSIFKNCRFFHCGLQIADWRNEIVMRCEYSQRASPAVQPVI